MSRSFVIISFFFWPATASMLRPMLVPNIFFGSSMARASGGCFDADHLIYSAAVHFTPTLRTSVGLQQEDEEDIVVCLGEEECTPQRSPWATL